MKKIYTHLAHLLPTLAPFSIPWSIYQTSKNTLYKYMPQTSLSKCGSLFFFLLFKIIKRNFKSYYGPFLKEGNVFYRVSSITNFPQFSTGFRGPQNGQIKSYSPLNMGPGGFLCLWGVSLWLKLKKKNQKIFGCQISLFWAQIR